MFLLPHHLVASFRATLKEVTQATLLLHVVDVSDERFAFYINEVDKVLKAIEADEIEQLIVFNKIDKLDEEQLIFIKKHYPNAIFVSAVENINIDKLLDQVENQLNFAKTYKLFIPFTEQKIASKLEKLGEVVNKDYQNQGTEFIAVINDEDMRFFKRFLRFSIADFYPNI
ncbi:MAG: hypothetical protein B6226_05670 [Candidatus Cloacimonetes bacterium 4572_65]|nr:MAG: hypothetical protein B6226_05670 [Candidatus Cloacimonetes bacterium 4572_65]